ASAASRGTPQLAHDVERGKRLGLHRPTVGQIVGQFAWAVGSRSERPAPAILTTMPDFAEQLRALHRTPPIFVLPNAWDAASARLLAGGGFPAVATTSAGVAASLGYPDGGAVPAREMFEAVARIARSVKVPVTADIEHAYAATPDAVADNVLRVIAAGAV